MDKISDWSTPETGVLDDCADNLVMPELAARKEIVVAFSPAPEAPSDHRFKADNQLTVVAMSVLAAAAAVSLLSGAEHLLWWAIDFGILPPPPGPETYALSFSN
ncbi:hypothetical protein [Aurantiacibacter hainanensis]|uniref:hypothetical protein n=1 Tax=Aurantiacibacter hainanensis TaxID=3076114 RepID=UPI0030C6FB6A